MPFPQIMSQRGVDPLPARIDRAIERLKSLHDGDAGLTEVLALGSDAIAPLRRLLFEREPSGLHQVRCRAAEALAGLGAFDVLAEFLRRREPAADAAERLGDEVVMSTAAQVIARRREDWVYELLTELAARHCLRGALAGLGSFRRKESIPIFVEALGEDETRPMAESMLRGFGNAARPALLAAALDRDTDTYGEGESHLRKRRSALALLLGIGVSRREWRHLRRLIDDSDRQIALHASEVSIGVGTAGDRARAWGRLRELKEAANWFERERVGDLLKMLGKRMPARRI